MKERNLAYPSVDLVPTRPCKSIYVRPMLWKKYAADVIGSITGQLIFVPH